LTHPKYAFFDITKEMCYIPLNNELKAKGKAVIDVFCFKLGKILGALLPSIIFSIFPNLRYSDISAQLFIIFIIVCIIWVTSVKKLSRMYCSLIEKEY
jgi:AAA family ATP:ADP antiporter